MLTHVHLLGHTWWCWHILRRRWRLKGREGFGFLSPSRWACEAGFSAFEKIKCIFSIAQMESLEKSLECSPDALIACTGRWACASSVLSGSGAVRVKHQTLCTGRGLDPVYASGVAWLQWVLLTESTGHSRCIRLSHAFADLSAYVTGVHQTRLVLTWARLVVRFWRLEIDTRGSLSGHMAMLWSTGHRGWESGASCLSVWWSRLLPSERANGSICLRSL